MPREAENVGEVVLGSAGQALEQLGQLYPQYQAQKRQGLLNAFSMQLKLEAAESDREVGRSRMAHLAALSRLADLRGEEVMLKMANFLPPIKKLEAEARIKREGLEYSMEVAREAVSAPGEPGEGVVIPSGVKVWERPVPGGAAGRAKTLSAKDQYLKTYYEEQYSPEEAAERFADYINPEKLIPEMQEYYRILRAQLGSPFFNIKDPESVEMAQQFSAKAAGVLPEAKASLQDVLDGLQRKLKAGKIDQTQYDDAIRQINASLGVENVEAIFGR